MSARILEGRSIAARIREDLTRRVAALAASGRTPGIAIVRFADTGPEVAYAQSLARAASAIGAAPRDVRLADDVHLTDAAAAIAALNADLAIAGIVVIYPVPAHLDPDVVGALVDPAKDVDGASPVNADRLARAEEAFVPATAVAVDEILRAYAIPVQDRRVVVVGRSKVVGEPTAALLANHGGLVTVAHSETADVAAETIQAEILVVAVGKPGLIGPSHVNPDAVVIDCGINVTDDGVVGDVDFDRVEPLVAAITPVPGGVGPVTTVMLLGQAVTAAERQVQQLSPTQD
ncbi:MAG TPA: bifunctional 5,10-methylenetetrahydrofolate dehydrogenase/5,10-methenyltetrahydrofolate cyclohydrolase [Candidatus Limnocylindria bacterium]|jgi:methylenetetrahydrofolate dehydrogenase (NADP+)/methenyltetrahydrofolate cyclohydrolase